VSGFWRPRRQPDTEEAPRNGSGAGPNVATDEDVHDPELAAQLAHLEEIERRHEQLYAQGITDGGEHEVEVTLPEEAWPEAIPPPPHPEDGAAALLRWLDTACAVLDARASRNRDELQRLTSQWVHISRNLARFRGEEVAAVAESQARLRERIAGDETAGHLIRLLQATVAGWPEPGAADATTPAPLLGAADLDLVRRLLDGAAEDRAGAVQSVVGGALEALTGIALDMEVVQRQAEREPDTAGAAVRGLQERLAGAVEDLRARPGAQRITPGPGEALHATLRRCLDVYQQHVAGDLAWTGGEPASGELVAAALWIVQEFLAGMAAAGGREMRLALTSTEFEVVLRLTAAAPPAAVEAGWALRCRARAAVSGGSLALVDDAERPGIEVRFPLVPG